MLWMYKRVIFGKIFNEDLKDILDLKKTEIIILCILALPILFFGFYPEPLFNSIEISVTNFLNNYNTNLEINLANK